MSAQPRCECGTYEHVPSGKKVTRVCEPHRQTRRVYMKATVAKAERLSNGRWLVRGHGWLKEGVEFSEEDFRNNFEQI